MNPIFIGIVVIAFAVGAYNDTMAAVTTEGFAGAKTAVEIAIGLAGYMTFFLGLIKVGEEAGLLRLLARTIRPVMVRLFPEVPPEHPAMGAMIMNIAANVLGLTNAATPLGLKAMKELERLNRTPGTATNAMVLFLALNTSGLALLPSGVVAARASNGSQDPWGIFAASLMVSAMAGLTAALSAYGLSKLPIFAPPAPTRDIDTREVETEAPVAELLQAEQVRESELSVWGLRLFLAGCTAILVVPIAMSWSVDRASPAAEVYRQTAGAVGDWVLPGLVTSIVLFGMFRKVKVYEVFVAGAREGFNTALMIIPYLVAILTAVGMFRGSGAMNVLSGWLSPLTEPMHMPAEVLPMALLRPLSGQGSYALMTELLSKHGPDSYIGYLSSVMNGATDTTFYVLAVYFGSVGIARTRHAVAAGLLVDLIALLAASWISYWMWGHLPLSAAG